MKKLVGYVVMLLGVALILVKMFGSKFNIILPEILSGYILWIVAVALLAIGFFISMRGRGSTEPSTEEVPIYRGEEIVGYRKQ